MTGSMRIALAALGLLVAGCAEDPPPPFYDGVIREPLNIYVFFPSGSATLTEKSRMALSSAKSMERLFDPRANVWACVSAHADAEGPEALNRQLSRRRADAVAEYLIELGIPRERIVRRSFGSSQPLVANSPPGKPEPQNRYATIWFAGPGICKPTEAN
ncbi:MAG TPA: OmpA family protein [Reyranella sp.]|nr:OmpA family protein [Reyranella sp.]